jgi:hypothetical protein
MHLSARSELKSELADSRIETKLPIREAGLLHVCLTDARDSHAGALNCRSCRKGRDAPPVHMIELTEKRKIHTLSLEAAGSGAIPNTEVFS